MWNYPKSPIHQAAIEAEKPQIDREAARALAAQKKLSRQSDGENALKECEATRVAVLAKTKRLRAARLAREAIPPIAKPKSSRKN